MWKWTLYSLYDFKLPVTSTCIILKAIGGLKPNPAAHKELYWHTCTTTARSHWCHSLSTQPTEETHRKTVVSNFPRAKTQSLTSPEGGMTFFWTCQTIENIGNQIKKILYGLGSTSVECLCGLWMMQVDTWPPEHMKVPNRAYYLVPIGLQMTPISNFHILKTWPQMIFDLGMWPWSHEHMKVPTLY